MRAHPRAPLVAVSQRLIRLRQTFDEAHHFRVLHEARSRTRGQNRRAFLRLRDQKALHVVHADFLQRAQRIRVLDPFRHAAHAQVARQRDDRLDDRDIGRMRAHRADELAVDLQRIGGKRLQVLERRVARAEIVERDLAAHVVHARDKALRVLKIVQRDALGDFEAQVVHDRPVLREQREDVLHELLVVERPA